MTSQGFIEVWTGDPYHRFLRTLVGGNPPSYVGFYYLSLGIHPSPLVEIYDIYTGKQLTILPQGTLETLTGDSQVSKLVLHSYQGPVTEFKKVLGSSLYRYLDEGTSLVWRAKMEARLTAILGKLGSSPAAPAPYHGYLFVNYILASLAPGLVIEPCRLSSAACLARPSSRDFTMRTGRSQGTVFGVGDEFTLLMQVFQKLYIHKSRFGRWFDQLGGGGVETPAPSSLPPEEEGFRFEISMIGGGPAPEAASSAPLRPEGSASGAGPALANLLASYREIVTHIEQGLPPIIYLSEHLDWLKELAPGGLRRLSQQLPDTSLPAVIRLTPGSPGRAELPIHLPDSSQIVLPIRTTDFSHLGTQQLKDILVYLDGLNDIDRRYLPLQLAVGKALALRSQR